MSIEATNISHPQYVMGTYIFEQEYTSYFIFLIFYKIALILFVGMLKYILHILKYVLQKVLSWVKTQFYSSICYQLLCSEWFCLFSVSIGNVHVRNIFTPFILRTYIKNKKIN